MKNKQIRFPFLTMKYISTVAVKAFTTTCLCYLHIGSHEKDRKIIVRYMASVLWRKYVYIFITSQAFQRRKKSKTVVMDHHELINTNHHHQMMKQLKEQNLI